MEPQAKFGKYEIVRVLGRGGMGVVYEAFDRALGRSVALKAMTAEVATRTELRMRFLREARAVAKLQHPNIVVVHELGEEDGTPFIAMEFLEGSPLDDLLVRGMAGDSFEKIEIVIQVAKALQHAHSKGVIHRDIKPANIMRLTDGTVKVVDFGIAHLANQTMTGTGVLLGTLAYLSPEQLNGEGVDHRTDIFSLGIVLYEMFSGSLPFAGPTPAETMRKILLEPPPPLDRRVADYPPALQGVLDRALAKNQAERYQSCAEMIADLTRLQRILASPPVSERAGQAPAIATAVEEPPAPRVMETPGVQERSGWALRPIHGIIAAVILAVVVSVGFLYYRAGKSDSNTDQNGGTGTPSVHQGSQEGSATPDKNPAGPATNSSGTTPVNGSASQPTTRPAGGEQDKRVTGAITEGDWHMTRGEYGQAILSYRRGLKISPQGDAILKQKIVAAVSAQSAEQRVLRK